MKKIECAGLFGALCLAFTLPVTGQRLSVAETACNEKYAKYFADQANLKLFDNFVNDATCKASIYREGAYQLMMSKLVMATKLKDALYIAARFTTEIPDASKGAKQVVYSLGLYAATSLDDADKVIVYREKILAIDPKYAVDIDKGR